MAIGGDFTSGGRARCRLGIAVLLASALAACAPDLHRPQSPSPVAPVRGFVEVGLASWYGRYHAGRPTASGEPFDPDGMTAAHRTLPLGTIVRVTNMANGRTVKVRINDRGPSDTSRVIDLSRGSAQALGFVEDGVIKVKIERLSPD
jgi:rare lipoprotein A